VDVLRSLATVYKAEADLYKVDDDPTKDRPEPLRDLLRALMDRLEEAGSLNEVVHHPGDEDLGFFGTRLV